MYPTILVPLDDSSQSRRILPYVKRLANCGGRLVLLQVVSDFDLIYHADDGLETIARQLSADSINVDKVVEVGDPTQVIVDVSSQVQADLIGMATVRWADLDRWLNGSVSDWVLRHTTTPVLVVPPMCMSQAWPIERGPSMLVPLDGSPLAEQAVRPTVRMAQLLNSEVVLMRAVDDPLERTGAEAQTYLDDVVTRVSAGNIRAVSRVVAGSPASAIQEVANEVGINLIAMATHGRTGVARVALGSVATRTLQRATVPMLLVHPKTVGAAVEHDTQATASRTTR